MIADRITIAILNRLIEQAEMLVVELQAAAFTPEDTILAAEQVVADLHHRRQAEFDAMILFPIGEC